RPCAGNPNPPLSRPGGARVSTSTNNVEAVVVPEAVDLVHHAMLTPEGRDAPYADLEALHGYGQMTMMPEGWIAVYGYEAASALMKSPDFGRYNPNRTTWVAWPRPLTPE